MIMIDAKNIELKNNSISLEYKTDIDNRYEKLAFDIDTLEIKETSILINEFRSNILYSHLMKPLVKLVKNNKLESEFRNIWY